MHKIEAQEKVFELIKEKYKKQGSIDSSDIYTILNDFGFTESEKQYRVKKHLFGFKGEVKTRGIIVDVEDIPFVPFSNDGDDKNELETAIKLYIPFASKDLTYAYTSFREFIHKEDIKSNNKARNRVACDDIVIRIFNYEDIEKVRNFVKKNSRIKSGIKYSNPFFAQDDLGISYSMDGVYSSANNELSIALYEYAKENINYIDAINRDGFKKYLHDYKTNMYSHFAMNLIQPESIKTRNLIELSMDEDFDYIDMIKYSTLLRQYKKDLSRMNIDQMINLIYYDLIKKHSKDDVINMMCNIEKLQESDFSSSVYYMFSRLYLTSELVLNYFSSISYQELGRNNKKNV